MNTEGSNVNAQRCVMYKGQLIIMNSLHNENIKLIQYFNHVLCVCLQKYNSVHVKRQWINLRIVNKCVMNIRAQCDSLKGAVYNLLKVSRLVLIL